MENFKECPRCGSEIIRYISEAEYFGMTEEDFGGENIYVAVSCALCDFTGQFCSYNSDARDRWNSHDRERIHIENVANKTYVIK